MFVKTTVRKRGDKSYTYLSLVESVRVKGKMVHNTLLRLGEVSQLRESGQLDRIIGALRAHAGKTWVSVDEAEAQAAPGYGAVAAVKAYFERLQLSQFFADLVWNSVSSPPNCLRRTDFGTRRAKGPSHKQNRAVGGSPLRG